MDAPSGNSVPVPEDRRPRRRLYSAPRRFDLATVFVVTAAYAILLGGFTSLGAPKALTAAVALFVTLVGIGQAVLFRGRQPRWASALVGATIYALIMPLSLLDARPPTSFPSVAFILVFTAVGGLVQGALLGYFVGVLVGGVFLVADLLRRRF